MEDCPRCGKPHPNREGECGTRAWDGGSPAVAALPALAVAPKTLSEGSWVGDYRITGLIGQGGMGTVFAGIQPIIEKRVAIKVLSQALAEDASMVERFMQEARAVTRIDHPNIIDVYFFGQLEDGRCYFVMEHLNGESFSHLLSRRFLTYSEARRFLGQTCDALASAHAEGILHRDLKPDNLYVVRPRRGHAYIKVLDFGVAKLFGGDQRIATRAGIPIGTPEYMSPEQARGDEDIDARTDIYAIGILLYQVMTGEVPFSDSSVLQTLQRQMLEPPVPPSEKRAVPPGLNDLILRCLAKNPDDRPSSMVELVEDLEVAFDVERAAIAAILTDESVALQEHPPAGGSFTHDVLSPPPNKSPAPHGSARPLKKSPHWLDTALTTGKPRAASPAPGHSIRNDEAATRATPSSALPGQASAGAPRSRAIWVLGALSALIFAAAGIVFWLSQRGSSDSHLTKTEGLLHSGASPGAEPPALSHPPPMKSESGSGSISDIPTADAGVAAASTERSDAGDTTAPSTISGSPTQPTPAKVERKRKRPPAKAKPTTYQLKTSR